jgi:hypothetical protein
MVVSILSEGRGQAAMFMQLNAPAIKFDPVQPLLTASVGAAGEACSEGGRTNEAVSPHWLRQRRGGIGSLPNKIVPLLPDAADDG